MNRYIIPAVLLLSILGIFAVFSMSNSPPLTSFAPIGYNSNVCILKNGELIECSSNILYETGQNMTKEILGDGGTAGPIQQISLCNATIACDTPVAGATEAYNEFAGCGLSATAGTYADLGVGNWSIEKTFTSACDDVVTNVTRLQNSTGDNFAGNTFTVVTLNNGDTMTVNWTIWVS